MGFYNATKSLGSTIGSLLEGFLYAIHVKLPFVLIAVVYALSVAARRGISCTAGSASRSSAEKTIPECLPFFRGDILYFLRNGIYTIFFLLSRRRFLYNGLTSIPHGEGKEG